MRLEYLLNQYNDRVAGPEWFSFVGYVDSFHAELNTIATFEADRREVIGAQKRLQNDYLEHPDPPLFQRLIAAELLSLFAIDLPALERSIDILLERAAQPEADDYHVAASLSAHLTLALESPANIDSVVSYVRGEITQQIRGLCVRIDSTLARRQPPPTPLSPPDLRSIKTLAGLLPGDCLFRRQSKPWYGNPFRDFGHTGLYIGCTDSGLDGSDCSNHVVVHVVSPKRWSRKPACQITTLLEFCNPAGKPEQFWGAYRVGLSSAERSKVISTAYSLANGCTYSFTKGYKNIQGKSFRCDGFVEYCHETSMPSKLPLSYRGGLFEDDDWETMNPKALRNCLIEKIAIDIAPCCDSQAP